MIAIYLDGIETRTVQGWHAVRAAGGYGHADSSVWTTIRNYAAKHGRAVAWGACDTVTVYERQADGKVSKRTHKPGTVAIDYPGKNGSKAA